MKGLLFCVLAAAILGAPGCEAANPLAPDAPHEQSANLQPEQAVVSGWVYARVTWADPPIAGATIELQSADGFRATAVSDRDGYYEMSIPHGSGAVSITTSKDGYRSGSCRVTLLKDTVLNFFLAPI